MELSIFDIIGPVMIGPSSSHTAGAAKLGRAARKIVGGEIQKVSFGLCGSFAKTCRGHGTDRALLAGVMGMTEQDEHLSEAFELAEHQGIEWEFHETELENAHENTAVITLTRKDGRSETVVGSSLGGGRICINRVNEFETEMELSGPTLLLMHYDHPGVIRDITSAIADHGINIATMRLARKAKGDVACTVVEVDGFVQAGTLDSIRKNPDMIEIRLINLEA